MKRHVTTCTMASQLMKTRPSAKTSVKRKRIKANGKSQERKLMAKQFRNWIQVCIPN